MGSSTKKHKKDSKKHKHRSRSPVRIVNEASSSSDVDRKRSQAKHNNNSNNNSRREKSLSLSLSPTPPPPIISASSSNTNRHHQEYYHAHRSRSRDRNVYYDERSRDRNGRERDRHQKLKYKERKNKNRSRSRSPLHQDRERERDRGSKRNIVNEYESDSSDCVEVPVEIPAAPPAPVISKSSSKTKNRSPSPRKKSASPIPENGAGDCLSVSETNKLRAKLGLKPLEIDSGPTSSKSSNSTENKKSNDKDKIDKLASYKDEWGEFTHKPAKNITEKAAEDKIREKLQQRKEKRSIEDKLRTIKNLGESDEEVDDIQKWVSRSKQKDQLKREADKRAKMLEEMDAEFGVENVIQEEKRKTKNRAYRDRDLKGLRVDHDLDEFAEGKSVILTLKDKGVLDEEDDTLINVNLIDEERYRKNIENKKMNPLAYGYNVYEEQYDEFGNPIERNILGKYDDETGSTKKKTFTIGENAQEEIEHRRKLLEIKTKLAGKKLETLHDTALKLASDTYSEIEIAQFKKPKKKIKKIRQKLRADDLEPLADTAVKDLGSRSKKRHENVKDRLKETITGSDNTELKEDIANMKVELEDEDDLQRCLSKARRLKQKEGIIRKDLQIDLSEVKPEIKEENNSDDEMNGLQIEGHITLNATAEFCRTLGDIPTYGMAGNRNEDSNDIMDFDMDVTEDQKDDIDYELRTGTWNSVDPDKLIDLDEDDLSSTDMAEAAAILDEEPDVGAGVGAALKLALSKGYLEKEDKNRPSNSKMAHLQAKNYSIDDKSYGDEEKQFSRRDRYHGPISDFKDKETFKPNVKLEYIDDNGRILNAKEAFRYLSHKFHGKGPGKNKIEKRLKKMEQEGLMKTMSSTDTPLCTLTMLQQKQKETATPYVVLSGGGSKQQLQMNTTISKHTK